MTVFFFKRLVVIKKCLNKFLLGSEVYIRHLKTSFFTKCIRNYKTAILLLKFSFFYFSTKPFIITLSCYSNIKLGLSYKIWHVYE